MAESSTNTGDIVGKVDQHMGNHKSESGYKWQYVDVDKNKKLGLIHRGNVNSILYNLLWDIVSHQVDNETAKGEMKEINWIMKRFSKDDDRDDDTGVSNETIHKHLNKAKDIVAGMKSISEDNVYIDNGKITKRSSETAKKLNESLEDFDDQKNGLSDKNEEVSEDLGTPTAQNNQLTYKKEHDSTGDHWVVYNSNGVKIASYESEDLAKKAVQGKGLNEEYDPFTEMIKDKDGRYTDGRGGSYKAPTDGTTKWIRKNGYKYRYNFKTKQLEIADNSGDVIISDYLALGNWLDNPEYWFDKLYKDMEAEEDAFIKDYLKKHPEEDKTNIHAGDLKEEKCCDTCKSKLDTTSDSLPEEKTNEDIVDDISKVCGVSKKEAKEDIENGIWTDDELEDIKNIANVGSKKKKSIINKILNSLRVNEEKEKKFDSLEDLSGYLKNKNSVIILYQDNQYSILDEEIEDV